MQLPVNTLFWAAIIGLTSGLFAWYKTGKSFVFWVTFVITTITVSLWNWIIGFTNAAIYLDVDHPIFRISWADFLDGVCVFAAVSLILGILILKEEKARVVAKIAAVAAIITIVTDIFFF